MEQRNSCRYREMTEAEAERQGLSKMVYTVEQRQRHLSNPFVVRSFQKRGNYREVMKIEEEDELIKLPIRTSDAGRTRRRAVQNGARRLNVCSVTVEATGGKALDALSLLFS